ncbi:MAG: PIG-L family deacetylase [Pseudomonadota bacterium]
MTPDQRRLAADQAAPEILSLWRALRPLTSVLRFMNSGAHPDDETSDLLAALAFRDGYRVSIACSTRGEGGQNDIGQEAGAALGALRTREMEAAATALAARVYWFSEQADDPITDFGFSKSGEETLARWGQAATLRRFVDCVRAERPDILCPTFLDVPGQHGHHRAMTAAAAEVVRLAADPGYVTAAPPWQVAKLLLPAWSGAGQAYDDGAPPPEATFTVPGQDREAVTGWPWARVGQHSRAYHRTQGMGRWPEPGAARDWPLHLAFAAAPGMDAALSAGLPGTLLDLASGAGAAAAGPMAEAAAALAETVAAFPDPDAVADAGHRALAPLCAAETALDAPARTAFGHRVSAKIQELGHVLRHALGVEARGWTDRDWLRPGTSARLTLECAPGRADSAALAPLLPPGWSHRDGALSVAGPSPTLPLVFDPMAPPPPALRLTFRVAATEVALTLPLERPPTALPARTARITPGATLLNTANAAPTLQIGLADITPPAARPALDLPEGWRAAERDAGLTLTPPETPTEGLFSLALTLDGAPAETVTQIAPPHVAPTALSVPACLRLRVLSAEIPPVRVGYIGAGNDRVGHWLRVLGATVEDVSDAALAQTSALAAYDTVVIGIFAMRFRPALLPAMPMLHRWVEAGGTLLTLYHRPWDNWDPATVPPRPLEIGQPSLRWRVTDPDATVSVLGPHPILETPNRIGPQDWAGWQKERGLYFAKSWDPAYRALIEMADPGEAPHRGALLAADIGRGRHIHTGLILHHQMEALVPGAFRLMANFIARRA